MAKSRNEIVRKSMEKIYKRYNILLRRVDDADLIEHIEQERNSGKDMRVILGEMYERSKKRND